MQLNIYLLLIILNLITLINCQCDYVPILSGVTPLQTFGESLKKHVSNALDCKQSCSEETTFTCTSFLWPANGGDCYLYDKMNLNAEVFRDDTNPYVLYTRVCSGEATPSVGFCEFKLNQSMVSIVTTGQISPGIATQESCREFCMARYQGRDCDSYIVSPSTTRLSQCSLYVGLPSTESGELNLYVKSCQPPPVSCQYSSWSEWGACTVSCTKERTRAIVAQPTLGGAPCLDSELVGSESCTEAPCVPTNDDTPTDPNPGYEDPGNDNNDNPSNPVPRECEMEDLTEWTSWSTCDATCEQKSTRTVVSTDCDATNIPLESVQVCAGGECTEGPVNDDPGQGGNNGNTPEIGCRIDSIDPQTRPSSQGFKAVGAQQDCAAKCQAETSFTCEAYSTTGPGGPCILHGPIDHITKVTIMSTWYLQDINCVVNSSAATSICGWQMIRSSIGPLDTTASQWKSLGYAINADHCGTLCMMNHPMYKPTPCEAYAYSPAVPFTSPEDNCFMYTAIETSGTYDLYKLGTRSLYKS